MMGVPPPRAAGRTGAVPGRGSRERATEGIAGDRAPRADFHAYLRAHTTIGMVRECFGEAWYIHPYRLGFYAIRHGGGTFTPDGPQSLIRHCMWSEHLDDLADQLILQSLLDSLTPDELARVYQAGELPADLAGPGDANGS